MILENNINQYLHYHLHNKTSSRFPFEITHGTKVATRMKI